MLQSTSNTQKIALFELLAQPCVLSSPYNSNSVLPSLFFLPPFFPRDRGTTRWSGVGCSDANGQPEKSQNARAISRHYLLVNLCKIPARHFQKCTAR